MTIRKISSDAIDSGSITENLLHVAVSNKINSAYAAANTATTTGGGGYDQANNAYVQANAAYGQANSARSDANTTFATINTTFGTVNTNYQAAYAQANTARDTANNAYNNSNTKLSTSGGSISGDLAITGNLTVQGNATTINVTNLSVNDSMILLSTNAVGDSNDIGFIGHFDRDATATHAGLIRKATENRFYLFDNYEVEPTNNVIDVAGNNFRVGNLRLGIVNANSYVTAAGLDVTGQANAAYAAANNRVLKAGDTMTGQLNVSSGGLLVTGNVGIGTTNPGYALHAVGSVYASSSLFVGSDAVRISTDGSGELGIGYGQTATNQRLTVYNNTTAAFVVKPSGNVGIGTATPGYVLSTSSSVHGQYSQHRQSSGTGVGQEMYYMFNDSSGAAVNYASIYTEIAANTAGSHTGKLALRTVTAGTLSTKLLVDQTGNVGIGTASPLSLLYLQASAPDLIVNGTDAASTYGVKIRYNGSTTHGLHLTYYPNSAVSYIDNTYQVSSGYPYGDIYFRHNVAGTMTTRMTLKADGGNVGVGTTSPATLLSLGSPSHTSPGDTNRILNWYSTSGGTELHNSTHRITIGVSSADTSQPQVVGMSLFNSNSTNNNWSPVLIFGGLSTSGNYMNGSAGIAAQLPANSEDTNFRGGDLHFFTQGTTNAGRGLTSKLVIKAVGNVGIGTTNPSGLWSGDERVLHLSSSGGTAAGIRISSVNATAEFFSSAGTVEWGLYSNTSSPFTIYTSGSHRLRIDASGNMYLGLTGNPSGWGSAIKYAIRQASASGYTGFVSFASGNDHAIAVGHDGTVGMVAVSYASGSYTPLVFHTGGSERIRIATDGSVGVGTTNPGTKLDIEGSGAGGLLHINNTTAGKSAMVFQDNGTQKLIIGLAGIWEGNSSTDAAIATESGSNIRFYTNGSATERLRIDTSGNIGIGTTNPGSYKLQVQGDQYISGTLTEASSILLKENIDPISNALDIISKLVGVTYDRKDGSAKNRAGLIAEEVDQVLPNVVNKDEEGNPTGIQYTNLIAYLVESIKELKAEIDVLKSK